MTEILCFMDPKISMSSFDISISYIKGSSVWSKSQETKEPFNYFRFSTILV